MWPQPSIAKTCVWDVEYGEMIPVLVISPGSDGPRIHCGDEWGLHGGFAFRKVDCVSVLSLWMSGKTTTVYGCSSSKPEK